jgi:formate dehydrogenase maturation protein FdhE
MNGEIIKKKCAFCEKMRSIHHFNLNKYSEESDGRLKNCDNCVEIVRAINIELLCGK